MPTTTMEQHRAAARESAIIMAFFRLAEVLSENEGARSVCEEAFRFSVSRILGDNAVFRVSLHTETVRCDEAGRREVLSLIQLDWDDPSRSPLFRVFKEEYERFCADLSVTPLRASERNYMFRRLKAFYRVLAINATP